MKRLKKKAAGSILTGILILMLFILRQSINVNWSGVLYQTTGESTSNLSDEAQPLGEIVAGDVLTQRIYLKTGALQVGVRTGTYVRNNDAEYVLTVSDDAGNIIGKRELSAAELEDNQMCYVFISARTSAKTAYQLTLTSTDAAAGNAITCYGVTPEAGHDGCVWNRTDVGAELVTEIVYQKVFPIAESMAAFCAGMFLVYFFFAELKGVGGLCCTVLLKLWREKGKRLLQSVLLILLVLMAVLLLFSAQRTRLLRDSIPDETNAQARVYEEKLIYTFEAEESFDTLEIKFATYMQEYEKGRLCLALYAAEDGTLLKQLQIAAGKIKDNEYLSFPVGEISIQSPTALRAELWTEEFDEQPLAVYYTKQGTPLLRLGTAKRQYQVSAILGLLLLQLLAAGIYLWKFVSWSRMGKKLLLTALLSAAAGCLLNTYVNYHSISLGALSKNLGLAEKGNIISFSREEIQQATRREARYNSQGNIYVLFDQIYLRQLYEPIDSVTIYYSDEGNNAKLNIFTVYSDDGSGFTRKPEVYEAVYSGQETNCFILAGTDFMTELMISFSYDGTAGIADLSWDEQYYSFDKIVLNEYHPQLSLAHWSFWLGAALIWLCCLWSLLGMEEKAERQTTKGLVRLFIICSLLFGTVMSLLVPPAQVPDELNHMQFVFSSIGAKECCEEMQKLVIPAVGEVIRNAGTKVDREAYSALWKQKLSSYEYSFSPNLLLLKYPGPALGVAAGLLLELPVGWILFLAEMCALLLYTLLGALAVYIAPIKKPLFLFILLLPMAMQQAGSFSYDSLNNAAAMLAVAYFLHLILEKEKAGIRELLISALFLLLLLYIKTVYVLCGALLLLLPLRKRPHQGEKRKRRRILLPAAAGVGAMGLLAWQFILHNEILRTKLAALLQALCNPGALLVLLGNTVVSMHQLWLEELCARFGWLDGIMEPWIVWVIGGGLLLAACARGRQKKEISWSLREYLLCLAVFTVTAVLILFSMLGWSQMLRAVTGGIEYQIANISVIIGVQGRYFIPILVLLFLFPVSKKLDIVLKKLPLNFCLLASGVTMVIYSVVVLAERYWM